MSLEINFIDDSPLTTIKKDNFYGEITFSKITQSLPMTSDDILKLMEESSEDFITSLINEEKPKIIQDKRCEADGLSTWTCYGNKCIGCQILYRLGRTSVLKNKELEISVGRYKGKKIKIFRVPGFLEYYRRNIVLEEICSKINDMKEKLFVIDNKYINYISVSIIYNKNFSEHWIL